ncbi:site-specific DNA-methyltransferase [Amycolatopsis sp. NPDC051372]|uniref:DNA-methyltransferase n=1 Tax=Amycolatopsis sp. NPDC051372 TaxID=3155669 RepID=UPI00342849C0
MNPRADDTIHYQDARTTLYSGDATTILGDLPSKSVDCVVTSPPCWDPDAHQTRMSSNHGRLLGDEATSSRYLNSLGEVFAQLYRVLAHTGSVWLNLGDSYSAEPPNDVSTKALPGMPWRVAFRLQADGWILRNAIVWNRTRALSGEVRSDPWNRYHVVFLLTKQRRYFFNLDAIREPLTHSKSASGDAGVSGKHRQSVSDPAAGCSSSARSLGKNPGDVWSFPPEPIFDNHPTPFPVGLPRRCIAAGCPEKGIVLDPFSGAATTGLAARELGRSYVGIDLNPGLHNVALRRLGLKSDRTNWSAAA